MADFTITQTDWATSQQELSAIRKEVFLLEQGVPEHEEWDEHDSTALHFLAYSKHQPVGTARLLNTGKLTRMAVLKPFRNKGVGSTLIKAAINYARDTGVKLMYLDSQISAIPLYKKFGFICYDEPFLDAGIKHMKMRKTLEQKA